MQIFGAEYVVMKSWFFVDEIVKFLFKCVCMWMNKCVLNFQETFLWLLHSKNEI